VTLVFSLGDERTLFYSIRIFVSDEPGRIGTSMIIGRPWIQAQDLERHIMCRESVGTEAQLPGSSALEAVPINHPISSMSTNNQGRKQPSSSPSLGPYSGTLLTSLTVFFCFDGRTMRPRG